jgi:hypothetical protein
MPMPTFDQVRSALEIAFFVSGIAVAVAALWGLKQLRIMKIDMRIRNERAAKEKAIEFVERFMTVHVPLDDKFTEECITAKLQGYRGTVGGFTRVGLPSVATRARLDLYHSWMPALNSLEPIAAAFVNGVADERMAFPIIGRSFCFGVANDYDIISFCRNDEACRHWESIVSLYKLWSPRISKAELEANRALLDARIAGTNTETILPIGLS